LADRASVVRLVLREAGLLVIAGLVVGIRSGACSGARRGTMLFGLKPNDPFESQFRFLRFATM